MRKCYFIFTRLNYIKHFLKWLQIYKKLESVKSEKYCSM